MEHALKMVFRSHRCSGDILNSYGGIQVLLHIINRLLKQSDRFQILTSPFHFIVEKPAGLFLTGNALICPSAASAYTNS
jgi:hypothetical protein